MENTLFWREKIVQMNKKFSKAAKSQKYFVEAHNSRKVIFAKTNIKSLSFRIKFYAKRIRHTGYI